MDKPTYVIGKKTYTVEFVKAGESGEKLADEGFKSPDLKTVSEMMKVLGFEKRKK